MKLRLRIFAARVRVFVATLPVLFTIAFRRARTPRGRRALVRFGFELIAVFAVCAAVDLLPAVARHSLHSIAFGLSVGVVVPILSKRIWKPAR